MEGDLVKIIQGMQTEINKLEKENQVLRMELMSSSWRASGSGRELRDEREEPVTGQSPEALRAGAAWASTPTVREHQGHVMIVRRYCVSPSTQSFAACDPWRARDRPPKSGIPDAQRILQYPAWSSIKKRDDEGKTLMAESFHDNSPHQRDSPEFGCRDKIKTVSFLLPMDLSSNCKNSSSLKYSPNQSTTQLSIMAEKDV
ncbi:putative coiled-coil domain-containing protein 195 [Perognathus longimembris pacificus]|uniref:putative coiled-coil domain-containing protein 195 n=1 Tax=Perognathus longimembris pacificus TaxID=214514 RepID=UPI002019EFBF|nr:putative coiled-coil domain-containing protein 195 [Perognathus longimembris pacificus]